MYRRAERLRSSSLSQETQLRNAVHCLDRGWSRERGRRRAGWVVLIREREVGRRVLPGQGRTWRMHRYVVVFVRRVLFMAFFYVGRSCVWAPDVYFSGFSFMVKIGGGEDRRTWEVKPLRRQTPL